ncbi:Lactonase, 7-bladed beta-propeller-domain-containing protein [Mucidula mucida]|nr:Lactonase, 7-bladed beta-propeller-domain-containing protein [Mucidula mucida]
MSFNIVVGGYSESDLFTLTFDPEARTLKRTSTVQDRPSWLTAYPGDKSLVFTCLEQQDGAILALRYDAEGKGEVIGRVPSGGGWPCAMLATKDELFVANYGTGYVPVIPISFNAPYFLSQNPTVLAQFTGKGPHERQQSSHPHHINFLEDRQEFFVPDLGGDRVYRFKKDASSWSVVEQTAHAPRTGGRHTVIYDGVLYTVLELGNRLTAHRLSTSSLELIADIPSTASWRNLYPCSHQALSHVLHLCLQPRSRARLCRGIY